MTACDRDSNAIPRDLAKGTKRYQGDYSEMLKLTEEKASIHPLKSKLKISILSDEEISGINQTALNILEDIGFVMPSVKALTIFADAGADVDFDKQLVKLPNQLVVDAMKTVPRQYTLCGRRQELDAHIGSEEGTYFYCSGESPRIVDMETGERRLSVKRDVEQMAQIADYLSIVSLVWPTVSASDKGHSAPLHGLEACFTNTEKHVQTESVMDRITAKYAIEMASVIAGGTDRLRERPIHSFLLCAIQPLAHDRGGIEGALAFAEAGLPVGVMSMPTLGLTSPPYSAGSLAMALAEVLSGCVLTQIAYPGTPNFISIIPSIIDPRRGSYFMGSSAAQITSAACVELAHSNGLPITSCMSFGGSQFKLNNWQAGIENFYAHLLAVMAGADMSFGPSGMIEAVRLLDMRRIMYDREIFQVIDAITDGFEVNENTLAFDMIREVGPRGMFMAQRRTAIELPKLWPQSILFEEPDGSENERYKDPFKVAHESIEWILKNHRPEPLPAEMRRELKKIVACADQDEELRMEVKGGR
jgi:trimethylamine--corrinoid protein Co-methyltransferase